MSWCTYPHILERLSCRVVILFDRRFWLGLTVSGVFIGLLLWQIDFSDTFQAFNGAKYHLFVPAIAFYFVALAFRTLRWQVMLRPLKDISFGRLFPVMSVGYMANNVMPVRLGELVRSYYLGEREQLSKSAALATVAIERVIDGVMLVLLLVAISPLLPISGLVRNLAEEAGVASEILIGFGAAPFLIVLIILMVAAYRPDWPVIVLTAISRILPNAMARRIIDLTRLFVGGLVVLREPRRFAILAFLSLPVWLSEALMYYIIGIAFDLTSSLGGNAMMMAAMLATTSVSNLATAIPSSQGGIGPFELFGSGVLIVLGVEREVATAYILALHIALLVPVTVLGLVYLWNGDQSLVHMMRLSTKTTVQEDQRNTECSNASERMS